MNTESKSYKLLQKIFEIMPGLLLWLVLTSPLWMSFNLAKLLANLVIVLASYWLYRAIIFTIGLYIGYKKYSAAIKIDWLNKCKELKDNELPDQESLPKNSKLPKHLIVFPVGGAKYETLEKSLNAITNQNYPINNIYVSLSFEERLMQQDQKYFEGMIQNIKDNFKIFGDRLMIFIHPKDIEGEAIGAAANRTWGTKMAVEELEKKGHNIYDFLTTSPDEDIRLDKNFLSALSYEYLISPKRLQKFYETAIYLFANNYWKVPMLIRSWSMSLTMPILSSSVTHEHDRETWSCYTLNLGVMKAVNYWDTSIGIDDTTFYWRPFNYFDGDFECKTFFVPLYADAVYHPNKLQNYKAQYKQLVRWGWGVVAFPIAMHVLLSNKKIKLRKKIRKIIVMTEIIVFFKVAALIFTFTMPIIVLVNPEFRYYINFIEFPRTLEKIMQLLTILAIPAMYYKFKLMPPRPKDLSKTKLLISFLIEIPFHFIILYTYSFFPFIVGPTRMMFGKKHSFVVTKKN